MSCCDTDQSSSSLPVQLARLAAHTTVKSNPTVTLQTLTAAMATTLLTAALNPLIQESVRKMIGGWYMDFVIKVSNIPHLLGG